MLKSLGNVLLVHNQENSQVVIGEQIFSIKNEILAKFANLDRLTSSDFVFKHGIDNPEKDFLNYETAKELFLFLSDNQTVNSSLINIIYLAHYLGLQDWQILAPVLKQIKLDASFDLVAKLQKLPPITLPLDIAFYFKNWIVKSPDFRHGSWSPRADKFFTNFYDENNSWYGQFYDRTGKPLGCKIIGAHSVKWNKAGTHYFLEFFDESGIKYGQFYDQFDNRVGNCLVGLRKKYSSNPGTPFQWYSDICAIRFENGTRYFYNFQGEQIHELDNAINWQWDWTESYCLVQFSDGKYGLWDKLCYQDHGKLLEGSTLEGWNPAGDRYVIAHLDGSRSLYDKFGKLLANNLIFENYRWSDNGDRFFAVDRHSTQYASNDLEQSLYFQDGTKLSDLFSQIKSVKLCEIDNYDPKKPRFKGCNFYDVTGKIVPDLDKYFAKVEVLTASQRLIGDTRFIGSENFFYIFIEPKGHLVDKNGAIFEQSLTFFISDLIKSDYEKNENVDYDIWIRILKSINNQITQSCLYDKNGVALIRPIANVYDAKWSLDSKRYVLYFVDNSAQFYDNNGNPVGTKITGLSLNQPDMPWSWDGKKCAILMQDEDVLKVFDQFGCDTGVAINHVNKIAWSNNGGMFIIFNDESGQFYNDLFQPVGHKLAHADIRDYYFSNFVTIDFNNYTDADLAGWKINGYEQRAIQQIYSADGVAASHIVRGASYFDWLPDREQIAFAYYYNDLGGVFYEQHKFDDLSLAQQILIQAILKQFTINRSTIKLSLAQRDLLPINIINKLESNEVIS